MNNKLLQQLADDKWINISKLKGKDSIDYIVFFFPHAGGDGRQFEQWDAYFPQKISFIPMNLPGKYSRWGEAPCQTIEEVIRKLVPYFKNIHSEIPFSFFGHSLGALIAFELARGLDKAHCAIPENLFLSSFEHPHNIKYYTSSTNWSDSEFLDFLISIEGISLELAKNKEMIQFLLLIFRHDFLLIDRYQYSQYPQLKSSIKVFSGIDDISIDVNLLKQWSEETACDFNLELFPGGHFYIYKECKNLAQVISNSSGINYNKYLY